MALSIVRTDRRMTDVETVVEHVPTTSLTRRQCTVVLDKYEVVIE